MRRSIIILLPFLFSLELYAQDSSWQKVVIDKDLTVSLPGKLTIFDSSFADKRSLGPKRFKTTKGDTKYTSLAVITTPDEEKMNFDSRDEWESALSSLVRGAMVSSSEQGFQCSVTDTTINENECKKTICRKVIHGKSASIISYYFIIHGRMYNMWAAFADADTKESVNDLNQLLKSIHFTANVLEEHNESKNNSFAYQLGRMIIPLLLIAGVVLFIIKKA